MSNVTAKGKDTNPTQDTSNVSAEAEDTNDMQALGDHKSKAHLLERDDLIIRSLNLDHRQQRERVQYNLFI
ncbi:hypothetical protein SK128_017773 [Halocaridina rubra]|uniref:Uncharacterized protein n=1 Tax=Halocaridina rubra TaxID=373956 RepID=A0AAN9AGU1_HALRR